MIDCSRYAATLAGRPVAVYGLGRSGMAAVRALRAAGVNVLAGDDTPESVAQATALGAQPLNADSPGLGQCAALVLAPGISLHFPTPHPVVQNARSHDVEIIGDIECWARTEPRNQTIGITGTNGKSTTTALTAHILNTAGHQAIACGNIGIPILDLDITPTTTLVIEMSSFQLDLCPSFRPNIAAHINLTPDHLDRHGTLENYVAAKERIFEGPGIGFCGLDDAPSRGMFERARENQARALHGLTFHNLDAWPFEFTGLPTLRGRHNIQNALFAAHLAQTIGLSPDQIYQGLLTYPGLPHRQVSVRKIGYIEYINDSKATNADATEKALMTFDNIYWLVGGLAKAGGLSGLEPYASRIRRAYLYGTAAQEFAQFMRDNAIDFQIHTTLDQALAAAHRDATSQRGPATVLLSPACASLDQFKSYEYRGQVFCDLVNALPSGT